MTAKKNDKADNKPDYSLIPKVLMDQLSYCMMAGAEKYGRYNYTKGHNISQLIAAAERHLKMIQEGEDLDGDTTGRVGVDVHHAACVCANMLMLLHQRQLGTLTDDRYKEESEDAEVDPVRERGDVGRLREMEESSDQFWKDSEDRDPPASVQVSVW